MGFLTDLWLPILLSAVAVFIISTLAHMVFALHKGDYRPLADEDGVLKALRPFNIQPGEYFLPTCPGSMEAWKDPAVREKFELGPVGWLTVLPSGMHGFMANLVQWFLYSIAISLFTAYVADFALRQGDTVAPAIEVFRFAGTVAILPYAVANVPASIWRGRPWRVTWIFVGEGVAYALATGGVFAWLWPAA